ncbi:hypothetical protein TNCV_2325561 [Trichonephila clavipes]|nr:hypothetical protein TNCV_2325561 [Trichonephila clavipes]
MLALHQGRSYRRIKDMGPPSFKGSQNETEDDLAAAIWVTKPRPACEGHPLGDPREEESSRLTSCMLGKQPWVEHRSQIILSRMEKQNGMCEHRWRDHSHPPCTVIFFLRKDLTRVACEWRKVGYTFDE